jgi:hypothetical protein
MDGRGRKYGSIPGKRDGLLSSHLSSYPNRISQYIIRGSVKNIEKTQILVYHEETL